MLFRTYTTIHETIVGEIHNIGSAQHKGFAESTKWFNKTNQAIQELQMTVKQLAEANWLQIGLNNKTEQDLWREVTTAIQKLKEEEQEINQQYITILEAQIALVEQKIQFGTFITQLKECFGKDMIIQEASKAGFIIKEDGSNSGPDDEVKEPSMSEPVIKPVQTEHIIGQHTKTHTIFNEGGSTSGGTSSTD